MYPRLISANRTSSSLDCGIIIMSSSSKKKKESSPPVPLNSKQHIRFDSPEEKDADHQKKKDDGIITSSKAATTVKTASNDVSSSKSQKRKKKRKRATAATSSDDNNTTNSQDKIFNGLILALSTDNKVHQTSNNSDNQSTKSCTTPPISNNNNTNNDDEQYETLKSLKTILQTTGATISPQVHKKVHYLICTQSAIDNLTQRIRQAIKRNVDIVSVDWVKKCISDNKRVDVTLYLCNEVAREIMVEKEREKKKKSGGSDGNDAEDGGYDSDILPQDDNGGWSEPVQLDCCCVCHENGDDNCPWCHDCNINLAKKQKKEHI